MTFTWDDGITSYSTSLWLPNVDEPQEVRGQVVPTLDLGAVWVTQEPASGTDIRAPRAYSLSWETADPDFLPIAETAFANKKQVTIGIPYRIHATAGTRWTNKSVTGYITAFEATSQSGKRTALKLTIQAVRA